MRFRAENAKLGCRQSVFESEHVRYHACFHILITMYRTDIFVPHIELIVPRLARTASSNLLPEPGHERSSASLEKRMYCIEEGAYRYWQILQKWKMPDIRRIYYVVDCMQRARGRRWRVNEAVPGFITIAAYCIQMQCRSLHRNQNIFDGTDFCFSHSVCLKPISFGHLCI